MALEPEFVAKGPVEDTELTEMSHRFWVSMVFTVSLLIFVMSEMIPGQPLHRLVPQQWAQWLQFALSSPVVLWGAWPFFGRAVSSVRTMNLNMFTLIGLGVAVAFGFSVIAIILPGVFSVSFRNEAGQVEVYFEAAAVIYLSIST